MGKELKKINKMKKQLKQLKMLKLGTKHALLIILILLSSACVRTVATDNFCLWISPISLLDKEIDSLSEDTLRQIDRINNEFDKQCP